MVRGTSTSRNPPAKEESTGGTGTAEEWFSSASRKLVSTWQAGKGEVGAGAGLWEELLPGREAWLERGPCMGRGRLPAVLSDERLASALLWRTETAEMEKIFEYKPVLDKVKSTHGLQPVDTTANRLFKRPRPAFLSAEATGGGRGGRGGGGDAPRFQARPAARAAGSGSAAAVAAAAAAAAASGGGGGGARKRARDGKSLAFGAGLMSLGAGGGGPAGSKGLPTTLAAMMDLASKEPGEFAKIIEEHPRLLEQLERKAAATTSGGGGGSNRPPPPPSRQGAAGGAAGDPRRASDPRRADPRRDPRRQRK